MPEGHFEAKKHSIRQTQDGWVISFVVHPNDVSSELAVAPLGTRYMVGWAAIGEDEQPVEQEEKPRRPFSELPRSQQAGMCCETREFFDWLERHNQAGSWLELYDFDESRWQDAAAEAVRTHCGVPSRSLFDREAGAAERWDNLYQQYCIDTGRMAEPR